MLHLLLFNWWLGNENQTEGIDQYGGIIGEDINWKTADAERFGDASNVKLVVMADKIQHDHPYLPYGENRSFEDILMEENYTDAPPHDKIGIGVAGLIASNRTDVVRGIAQGAQISSFFFFNATHEEHLQTTICHKPDIWTIAVLPYSHTQKTVGVDPVNYDLYIEPELYPRKMADDCFYEDRSPNKHLFVVPAPDDFRSIDPYNAPPARWPLIFTISGVTNRGAPHDNGSEGTGIFMCAPCANEYAPIKSLSNDPDADYINENFLSTNASAAIFAGALAMCAANHTMENPQVSDYFYYAALTSTVVYPKSRMWNKNNLGLYYNRQFGFGRVNVAKMVEAFRSATESFGAPMRFVMTKTVDSPLPNEEKNFTFEFNEDYESVICIDIRFHSKKLSFGSLNPHVISPKGTRSELKLITYDSVDYPISSVFLNSYEFLGENPKGTWTVSFRINDYSDHGTLETVELRLYCTKKGPKPEQIQQTNGSSPYTINESYINFSSDVLDATAAEEETYNISITNECVRNETYTIWFSEPDGENRIPLPEAMIINNFTQVYIPYFPSVFKDKMESYLVIDSFSPRCLYSSRVKLNYRNRYQPGIITPLNKTIIPASKANLEVKFALQLPKIVYAKFTGSAAVSILSPDSKILLKRLFQKNIGYIYAKNIIPNTKNFYLQVSPASTNLGVDFPVMTVEMFIREDSGKLAEHKVVNNVIGIIFLILFFVCNITFCLYRTVALSMM